MKDCFSSPSPCLQAYAAACKVVKDTPSRIKLIAARPPGVDYSSFFPYSVWLMDLGRCEIKMRSLISLNTSFPPVSRGIVSSHRTPPLVSHVSGRPFLHSPTVYSREERAHLTLAVLPSPASA